MVTLSLTAGTYLSSLKSERFITPVASNPMASFFHHWVHILLIQDGMQDHRFGDAFNGQITFHIIFIVAFAFHFGTLESGVGKRFNIKILFA